MSKSLNIHLWWAEEPDFFEKLAQSLICLPIDGLSKLLVGARDKNFQLQGLPKTADVIGRRLAGEDIGRDQIANAIDKLRRFDLDETCIEAEVSFPILTYNPFSDSVQDEPILVNVRLDYVDYRDVFARMNYKLEGPIRISFHQIGRFMSPEIQYLHQLNKMPRSMESQQDVRRRMEMAARIRHNYDIIRSIAKELISRVDPTHIIVCTEEWVHPLYAFTVYHRDWRDYGKDLCKIAQLHEHGGAYFCDVGPGDSAFVKARKGSDYGNFRSGKNSRQLNKRLQPITEAILKDRLQVELSKDQIEECLISSLDDVDVEQINDSYMISTKDAPHSHLEEPYFCLFEQALKNR